jgi:hypothetical protein
MGVPAEKIERFGLTRVALAHPCGIRFELVENPDDPRAAIANLTGVSRPNTASASSTAAGWT